MQAKEGFEAGGIDEQRDYREAERLTGVSIIQIDTHRAGTLDTKLDKKAIETMASWGKTAVDDFFNQRNMSIISPATQRATNMIADELEVKSFIATQAAIGEI